MRHLIIASTSSLHGQKYLEYLLPELELLYANCNEVVFIPYARPGGISHDEYTDIARRAFNTINISVKGLHSFDDPSKAILEAKGLFTGGGNTFVLVNQLHQLKLIDPLVKAINSGTPYLGTSAGSNICGLNMRTTNDMPIVYPPSFKTLGMVPFNINPHYLDPDPNSKHMGETREQRIKEFHSQNTVPVVGLREGNWLEVKGDEILLKGIHSARIFEVNQSPYEINVGTSLKNLS